MLFDPASRRLKLDPRDPAFFANPYPAYARLHASPGPVFWEDYGFWCLAQHAVVSAALRDRRLGRQILHVATREELGWPERPAHLAGFDALERHSLLELEPPEHTRLRGLIGRAFVSRQVERLGPIVAARAEALIDDFAESGEADLLQAFATPIPIGVIAEMIGAPVEDSALLLDWSHKMVALYQFGPTPEIERAADAAARAFADYVRRLIGERRRAPRDDLISQLIAAETGEGAQRGRAGLDGGAAAQRRARGDRPCARQRAEDDSRTWSGVRRVGGGDGGAAAVRPALASVHPLGA